MFRLVLFSSKVRIVWEIKQMIFLGAKCSFKFVLGNFLVM